MLTRLDPQSEEERKAIIDAGIDIDAVRGVNDIITTDQCFFAATGITEGELLNGVRYKGDFGVTHSLTVRGRTGTIRYIQAWHDRRKLSKMSSIDY